MCLFKELVQKPNLEWEFIDGSIVKAHQHSAGGASEENQAIGKSRGAIQQKFIWLLMLMGYPSTLK